MPETLFQKDVRVKRVTTIGYRAAQALNDPVRIKILEILSHKQMSAEEIVKALASSGFKKATTTIRHHLDTLKSAGLIQATKMVEVRGAVMKYYSPTLRAFSYDAPADLEARNAKLVEDTSSKLLKVLKSVLEDKKFAAALDGKNNGCSLCKNDHFKEYLALEILNAALAKAMEKKEYGEMTATPSGKESGIKPSKA
jgi:DNA-binding transcriptional ArsR family regulator